MADLIVLRTEQDGIEFYTLASNGECGMSQSGLARFCGVGQSAISKLEDTLMLKAPSKFLEPFVGQALTISTLMTNEVIIESKFVGNLKIYKADFCAAVIQHYASIGYQVALFSALKFMSIGINTWMQQINQWQPQVAEPLLETAPLDFDKFVAENQHKISEIKRSKNGELSVKFYRAVGHHKSAVGHYKPVQEGGTQSSWVEGELPYQLERVVQLSKNKEAKKGDGWITQRDIVQGVSGKPRPTTLTARQWMKELEQMGIGSTRTSGSKLEWHHTSEN